MRSQALMNRIGRRGLWAVVVGVVVFMAVTVVVAVVVAVVVGMFMPVVMAVWSHVGVLSCQ
jgi:hypothetical protein